MPSPRFDALNVYFSKKIGDPVASAATTTPTSGLTDDERDVYLNRAMMKLFNMKWNEVLGDVEKFIQLFPELYIPMPLTANSGGVVAPGLPSGYLNYKRPVEGYLPSGTRIKFVENILYPTVRNSKHKHYLPSTTNLFGFEIGGNFEFFPKAPFNSQTFTIMIIKLPLQSTGAVFTNGGAEDIPFYPDWDELIVETALQIWREDNQGGA
jgi:hypothetical protein